MPMRISGETLRVDVLDSSSLGLSLCPLRGLPDGKALSPPEAAGERFQVLPLRVGIPAADAVAVFADAGAARARARIAASRREGSRRPGSLRGGGLRRLRGHGPPGLGGAVGRVGRGGLAVRRRQARICLPRRVSLGLKAACAARPRPTSVRHPRV